MCFDLFVCRNILTHVVETDSDAIFKRRLSTVN